MNSVVEISGETPIHDQATEHLLDIIYSRFSCRFYSQTAIRKSCIELLLNAANQAPSAMNTQPWEFIVLTGEPLQQYRDAVMAWLEKSDPAEDNSRSSVRELDPGVSSSFSGQAFPKYLAQRKRARMKQLKAETAKIGIALKDVYYLTYLCYNSPVVIMVIGDRLVRDKAGLEIDQSVAAAVQNLLLAARAFKLGSCWVGDLMLFGDRLHRHLELKEGKQVVAAVALGHPDSAINHNRVPKANLDGKVTWRGFV